jgi:hypothetical protein
VVVAKLPNEYHKIINEDKMFNWINKLKFWQRTSEVKLEPLVILPPRTLTEMFDDCNGSSAHSNDRNRPYDGQPHTDYGLRGKTKIKGITFRDLRDCYIKGCLLSSGEGTLYNRAIEGSWLPEDVYKIDWEQIDPIAVAQNMSVEVEKLMGIYPNVPKLKYKIPTYEINLNDEAAV